jgi:hypothetical protein
MKTSLEINRLDANAQSFLISERLPLGPFSMTAKMLATMPV